MNNENKLINEYLELDNKLQELYGTIMRSKCTHLFEGKDMFTPINDGSGKFICKICGLKKIRG